MAQATLFLHGTAGIMRHTVLLNVPLAASLLIPGPVGWQAGGSPSCHDQIVSETVITTVCGHAAGVHKTLDLLIMWRGTPGWFQRREGVRVGQDVIRDFAVGKDGRVARYTTYSEVTIGFDANFEGGTIALDGGQTLSLAHDNAIVVDHVDIPHLRRVAFSFRVDTLLPLSDDANHFLARSSARVRAAFQCTPPVASGSRDPSLPLRGRHISTVCERLRR